MAEYSKKRRNLAAGDGGPVAMSSSAAEKLPEELVVDILSRLGTLNEAARCSSLCKPWRNKWRLISGGVLDFDKSGKVRSSGSTTAISPLSFYGRYYGMVEEKSIRYGAESQFEESVDQAVRLHCSSTLDALRIVFDLLWMDEKVRRWIEFGLTKRVKELTLVSCLVGSPVGGSVSLSYLKPNFLSKYDLSRLEVLELEGVTGISQGAVDHIFSNCPSLRRFALRHFFTREKELVIRVCSKNSLLQSLDFEVGSIKETRIELISAPNLHTFKYIGDFYRQVKFVGELPQLREVWFGGAGLPRLGDYLPWSRSQFNEFAPRLHQLGLELGLYHFDPIFGHPHPWMLFENLTVLDLFVRMEATPRSFLKSTVLLRAAPMLQELSIWFHVVDECVKWARRDLRAEPTWKHHSLKLLQLHGVHPVRPVGVRKPQLELAAYIIMNAPCLNQVLIDTRHPRSILYDAAESRLADQVNNARICEVKTELEIQLQGYTVSPQIDFTYR